MAERTWHHPIGTRVVVTDDFGGEWLSRTRSKAWWAGGSELVAIEGIVGGYLAARLRPAENDLELEHFARRGGHDPHLMSRCEGAARTLLEASARLRRRLVRLEPDALRPLGLVLVSTDPDEIERVLLVLARLDAASDDGCSWDRP